MQLELSLILMHSHRTFEPLNFSQLGIAIQVALDQSCSFRLFFWLLQCSFGSLLPPSRAAETLLSPLAPCPVSHINELLLITTPMLGL